MDNFAAARQMATEMAEADGHQWLMWADTDDIIEQDSCDIIRQHLSETATTTTLAMIPYRLTNNGLNLLRERIWRAGTAKWEGSSRTPRAIRQVRRRPGALGRRPDRPRS